VPAGVGVIGDGVGVGRPVAVAADVDRTVPAVMIPFLTVYSIR
jgi:hypothetical protein